MRQHRPSPGQRRLQQLQKPIAGAPFRLRPRALLQASLRLRCLPSLQEVPGLAKLHGDVPVTTDADEGVAYLPGGDVDTPANGLVALRELEHRGEPPPRFVVAERLENWKSLRGMVAEKGALGGSAAGLSALRAWGKQLLAAVDAAHDCGVLLGDISAACVFISPDGQRVKLGAWSQTSALNAQGRLAHQHHGGGGDDFSDGESSDDEEEEMGARAAGTGGSNRSAAAAAHDHDHDHNSRKGALLGVPGYAPPEASHRHDIGRSFDTWGVGLALLEAAAGKLPPKPEEKNTNFNHGSSCAPSSSSSFADMACSKGGYFDFFSVMAGSGAHAKGRSRGDAIVLNVASAEGNEQEQAARMAGNALAKALENMTMSVLLPRRHGPGGGAAARNTAWQLTGNRAGAAFSSGRLDLVDDAGGVGLSAADAQVEKLREVWVRVAAERSGDGGDGDEDEETALPPSWEDMYTKVSSHFEVLASDAAAAAIPGGGGSSTEQREDVHALAARSVAGALSGQDRASSGLLRYDQFRVALLDDLAFPLSDRECGALAQCALDLATGHVRYGDLMPLLTAGSVSASAVSASAVAGATSYDSLAASSSGGGGGWSAGAASATFLDVLGLCFLPDPRARPTAKGLLAHPFFAMGSANQLAALRDAEAVTSAPMPAVEWVEKHVLAPVRALRYALGPGGRAAADLSGRTVDNGFAVLDAAGERRVVALVDEMNDDAFDLSTLSRVLNIVTELVREEVGAGNSSRRGGGGGGGYGGHHRGGGGGGGGGEAADGELLLLLEESDGGDEAAFAAARKGHRGGGGGGYGDDLGSGVVMPGVGSDWRARHRPALLNALFRGESLEALAKLAAAVHAAEEASYVQRGFLEGDRSESVALRLCKRLALLGQELLFGLRNASGKGSALGRHAGSVMHFVTMLLLGRADALPMCHEGTASPPIASGNNDDNNPNNNNNTWRRDFSAAFRPLLLEAVTEEGGGNWQYPALRKYLHWCRLVADDAVEVEFDPVSRKARSGGGGFHGAMGLPFVRSSTYYQFLLRSSPQFDVLSGEDEEGGPHSSHHNNNRGHAKARASAAAYFAQCLDIPSDTGGGGSSSSLGGPRHRRRGGTGGNAGEDAAAFFGEVRQRLQLFVDAGVSSLLRNCLRDDFAPSRTNALLCCRNAVVTGFALGDSGQGGGQGGGDGLGTTLALSFCDMAWTAELASVLRSPRASFEDKERAVETLLAMAAFGERAVGHWLTADVPAALSVALDVEATGRVRQRQETSEFSRGLKPIGRGEMVAEAGGKKGGGGTTLDVRAVLEELHGGDRLTLLAVATAAPRLAKLLRGTAMMDDFGNNGHPGSSQAANAVYSRLLEGALDLAAPQSPALAACARFADAAAAVAGGIGEDFHRGPDSDEEVAQMRAASAEFWKMSSWLRLYGNTVRGAMLSGDPDILTEAGGDAGEQVLECASYAWGFGLMALDAVAAASPSALHPIAASVVAVAQEALNLLGALIAAAVRGAWNEQGVASRLLDARPATLSVGPASGGGGDGRRELQPPCVSDLGQSALGAFVQRIGRAPAHVAVTGFTHHLWELSSQLMQCVAMVSSSSSSSSGSGIIANGTANGTAPPPPSDASAAIAREVVMRCTQAQLGQRFGDALKQHANLVRRCIASRVVDAYLEPLYPLLQKGLRRLWTCLLRLAPRVVQLQEQLLLANVVEGLSSDWLSDLGPSEARRRRGAPVNFLREEAIHMLSGMSLRRERLGTTVLLKEFARQVIRHGVVTAEILRKGGADLRVVTLLVNLENRDIDLALVEEGIPLRALSRCRQGGSNDEIKMALNGGPRVMQPRQPAPDLDVPEDEPLPAYSAPVENF